MLNLRGRSVDVDFALELQRYEWHQARWAGDKLLACSPFRSERRPSFAVRLDTGVWIDSGTVDEEWRKGNFVRLLAWLRNETYEEAEDYLLAEYASVGVTDVDGLQLDFADLALGAEPRKPLDPTILRAYMYRHPYLEQRRGISEAYQRGFRVGYDRRTRAVTFPWFDRAGNLVNIKFRSVVDKRFWYLPAGQPVKQHLFALNHIHRKAARRAFIVESEIDAMTLWKAGFPAVALGGANMTQVQRDLLLQSPIGELVIATDNDAAGERIADSITGRLNGYLTLERLVIPNGKKDVNDLTQPELQEAIRGLTPMSFAL